jgi:hypothetical protein
VFVKGKTYKNGKKRDAWKPSNIEKNNNKRFADGKDKEDTGNVQE